MQEAAFATPVDHSGSNGFKMTDMYNDSYKNRTPKKLQPLPHMRSSNLDSEIHDSEFNGTMKRRADAAKQALATFDRNHMHRMIKPVAGDQNQTKHSN